MGTLILSFYGDGPKWENFVHLPAYPSGCSYFRPFRYRNKWVQPPLLKVAKEERESLDGREVLLGARFQAPDLRWSILPIRLGRLTRFRYSEEDHSIYFTVGHVFNHRSRDTLADCLLEIPEQERDGIGDSFLFDTSLTVPPEDFVDEEGERDAWVALVDRLARDASVTVTEEVRRAVFIRIQRPVKRKKAKKPRRVEKSPGEGPIFGFLLAEGNRYEFEFAHRLPALIDTDRRMSPFTLGIRGESPNLLVSPSGEEVSGNYQTHFFRVAGHIASDTAEDLVLDPEKDEVESLPEGSSPVPRLRLPVRVRWSPLHRALTSWMWFLLMALGLLLSNLIVFSTRGDIAGGDVWRFTLASTVAAVAIFAAQQRQKR
jgi:hypothetical protein